MENLRVLVVPSDKLGNYLTDRVAKLSEAYRHIEMARAQDMPFVLIAVNMTVLAQPLLNNLSDPQKTIRSQGHSFRAYPHSRSLRRTRIRRWRGLACEPDFAGLS
jgi:hypothetical protein